MDQTGFSVSPIDDSKLTPIQRLSIVGTSGMGALCYVPESYTGKDKTLPDLDLLQQMALEVLSEKSEKGEDVLYFDSGNSGQRKLHSSST